MQMLKRLCKSLCQINLDIPSKTKYFERRQ